MVKMQKIAQYVTQITHVYTNRNLTELRLATISFISYRFHFKILWKDNTSIPKEMQLREDITNLQTFLNKCK